MTILNDLASQPKSTLQSIRVGINPYFTGKVPKDAPDQIWSAFNRHFEHRDLTLDELAAQIWHGRALTAVCRGKRKTENFICRQDIGLDFDTEDTRSSLDTLHAQPFIAQYAALLHTTSSHQPDAPRARAIFILEQPVTNPDQYRRYAQALNWYFGTSDAQCHDPARVWFGSIGCEVLMLGNVLPIAVVDQLVSAWQDKQASLSTAQPEPQTQPPSINAYELLDQALKDGTAGNRNLAGFELAKHLRDAGYTVDAAREHMLVYQSAVERTGNHPYLIREAIDSLRSAYSHSPRVDIDLDALEAAALAGAMSANVQKTYFAILAIARKTGKTKNLALSLRSVEAAAFGFVDKSSVANHLAALVELGLLKLERKSNRRIGSQYSLEGAIVGHSHQETPPPALSVQTLHLYHELQAEPLCAIRAQFHPLMARDDDELSQSFGASAQRILAVLQSSSVDSLVMLQELTHLSKRTVIKKVGYLAAHKIVDVRKVGTCIQVKLNRFWRENIAEITPALTSFGTDLLRAERAAQQQIAHHEHMGFYTANAEEKAMCAATIDRAEQMIEFLQAHKTERMNERREWLQMNGLDPSKAPPLSLHPRSNPKAKVKLCLGSDQTKSHLPKGNNKIKVKALRRMKARLTPSPAAKSNHNRPILIELEQLPTERYQLGDINHADFGLPIS